MAQGFGQGSGQGSGHGSGQGFGQGDAAEVTVRGRIWDRRISKALDFASLTHVRACLVLVILALCFFLPGFFAIPPVDRDEVRVAMTSKAMFESGEWTLPGVDGPNPPGIHWMQAASVYVADLLGVSGARLRIWVYRLPSLAGGIGAILLTYWAALAFVSRRSALMTGMLLCASLLMAIQTRLAIGGTMLLVASATAMGAAGRLYVPWRHGETPERTPWSAVVLFWSAVALGIWLEGLPILIFLVLPFITLAVLDKNLAWFWRLKPLFGILWCIALLAPWVLLSVIELRDAVAPFVANEYLGRILNDGLGSIALPGLYFVLIWLTFWPAAPLGAMALPFIVGARRQPGAQFLLAWLLPIWIVLELFPHKPPHLVLPLFAPLAILVAGAMEPRLLSRGKWLVRSAAWWFVIPAVLSVLMVVVAIKVARQPVFLAWPFAGLAMVSGLAAWWLFDESRAERSMMKAIAASWLIGISLFGIVVPSLPSLFPSVRLAQILRRSACETPLAASAGFHEPSLLFMAGTRVALTTPSGAADFLREGACRYAYVEIRQENAFARRAEAIGLHYALTERVEGYTIARGRRVNIAVFQSDGTP